MPPNPHVRTPAHPDGAVRAEAGEWRAIFLTTLRDTGTVRFACQKAGISRKTAYEHRAVDEAFRAEWDDALEDAADALEAALRSRAMTKSDVAAIVLLKKLRPRDYREQFKHEHTGVVRTSAIDLTKLNADQLAQLEALLAAADAASRPPDA